MRNREGGEARPSQMPRYLTARWLIPGRFAEWLEQGSWQIHTKDTRPDHNNKPH